MGIEELAAKIARQAHATQLEQGTGDPYIKHIERVVAIVAAGDAKAVAWLHDVIEDTSIQARDLVVLGVPPRIVDAVVVLTRAAAHETYAGYIQRVKDSGNTLAIGVKLADLQDHLRANCPDRLRGRYEKALSSLAASSL